MTIKFTTNVSNDWEIIETDGFKRSDHILGKQEFFDLLEHLGYTVDYDVISDELMETMA